MITATVDKSPRDYFKEVAAGNISGQLRTALGANNPGLTANREEGVNNIRLETGTGGLYPYPLADVTVYASSSSGSDTGTAILQGLDDTYTEVIRFVTLSGQTPVAVSGDIFRITGATLITSAGAVGNIYFSTDNLDITAGVPDTLTNVLAKIDSGDKAFFASYTTVPLNKKAYIFEFNPSASKAGDVNVILKFRFSPTEDFIISPAFQAFQSNSTFINNMGTFLPEKTDIDITAISPTQGSKVLVTFSIILTDLP